MKAKQSTYLFLGGVACLVVTLTIMLHHARLPRNGSPVAVGTHTSTERKGTATPSTERSKPPPDDDDLAKVPLTHQQTKEERLQQVFVEHPEYKQAYFANLRRLRLRAYGDLASLLGIDRQTANRVSDLLVERVLSDMDVTEVLNSGGIKMTPAESGMAHTMVAQGIDNEIKQTIGADKYEILKIIPGILKYESKLKSDYSVDFESVNEPLTSEQIRALATVMAKNLNWNNRDMPDGPSDENKFLMKSELAVLQEAKGTLSDNQLAALKQRFVDRNVERYYANKYFPKDKK